MTTRTICPRRSAWLRGGGVDSGHPQPHANQTRQSDRLSLSRPSGDRTHGPPCEDSRSRNVRRRPIESRSGWMLFSPPIRAGGAGSWPGCYNALMATLMPSANGYAPPTPDPTLAEIKQRSAIERAGWTQHDFWVRSGGLDGTPRVGSGYERPSVFPSVSMEDLP